MSKRKHCCEPCCEPCYEPCCQPANDCCGNIFGGVNSCVAPIIFLLIAFGSGLLKNNKSYLIILLFLLCGSSFGNLFGGNGADNCCC